MRDFWLCVSSRFALVFLLAGVGVRTCFTQTDGFADVFLKNDPVPTVRKEVQEVNLILTVTDHRKHFVRNLTLWDITIQDNGLAPERITYFEAQTALPLRVALVIDTSDSVQYCLRFEKHAARTFLKDILHSSSDVALVIGFNAHARVTQGPTSNHDLLSRAIKNLPSGGNTAIYDAVALASQELGRIRDVQPSRRAIILITDGEDNSSTIGMQDAADIAQQNENIIYVLDIGTAYSTSKGARQAMKQLSEITGGQYLTADSEDRPGSAFAKLEAVLRSQYAIGYKPAYPQADGSFHRIVVAGPTKFLIRHRQGYFAR
ncbi:MAG TPA: VWA domain-containing protein [Terriglobales bacterium]|nr:VWA domain-containing protein [Terriglobales bacterium]